MVKHTSDNDEMRLHGSCVNNRQLAITLISLGHRCIGYLNFQTNLVYKIRRMQCISLVIIVMEGNNK